MSTRTGSKLARLWTEWRVDFHDREIPMFDPGCTGPIHTLILLESPGPRTIDTAMVSLHNPDPTARNLKDLVRLAFDEADLKNILVWNAVPWLLSADERLSADHLRAAKPTHTDLIQVLGPHLRHVVFMGEKAHQLIPHYSSRIGCHTRIIAGHHPGSRSQRTPFRAEENRAVFQSLGTCQP